MSLFYILLAIHLDLIFVSDFINRNSLSLTSLFHFNHFSSVLLHACGIGWVDLFWVKVVHAKQLLQHNTTYVHTLHIHMLHLRRTASNLVRTTKSTPWICSLSCQTWSSLLIYTDCQLNVMPDQRTLSGLAVHVLHIQQLHAKCLFA